MLILKTEKPTAVKPCLHGNPLTCTRPMVNAGLVDDDVDIMALT